MLHIKSVLFFVLFLSGLVFSSCSVETQKGRESFYNNQLPEPLDKIANQTLEISSYKNQIIARVNAEDKTKVLPIAVIDNGTDLAHPDLINQTVKIRTLI
jgi:hypothetical protein